MNELRTEIEIDAAPEKIWAVLLDFERYPAWNPLIRSISGEARKGSRLLVRIKPEGGIGMTLRPEVIAADANKKLAWKGQLGFSGIFDGRHEFIINKNGSGRVAFVHREEFSGFLVPVIWPFFEKKVRRGFEDMNAALKRVAEGS